MASDTVAILEATGVASAHIVGHSLGGCIAQQVALTTPLRVKSLSLFCTSARGADATDLSWTMIWLWYAHSPRYTSNETARVSTDGSVGELSRALPILELRRIGGYFVVPKPLEIRYYCAR
jgi:pimeloyl-ACP methyl ester carboxylesterase